MSERVSEDRLSEPAQLDNREWGENTVVVYEEGVTERWISIDGDSLVSVER